MYKPAGLRLWILGIVLCPVVLLMIIYKRLRNFFFQAPFH